MRAFAPACPPYVSLTATAMSVASICGSHFSSASASRLMSYRISSFSPVILATLAQADSTDSASKQEPNLDAARPRRLDDRQVLHFSGLRRQPAHKPVSEL